MPVIHLTTELIRLYFAVALSYGMASTLSLHILSHYYPCYADDKASFVTTQLQISHDLVRIDIKHAFCLTHRPKTIVPHGLWTHSALPAASYPTYH